ncbi:MAG: tRNA uridine-5-carboxymethylaminomethyl(34) synthesis GTPase MnmE [Duncaniella sp.]|nr:tRNA uridine-5-carboxymethylaminomethyl(34) synthesis GTPase MnmE [Duncaniella sp.]MDE6177890.1 tRNA uridine-5-carboxymethylaminomethyl(34) synthesis GTPase MnmE [Duncaniella sp.]
MEEIFNPEDTICAISTPPGTGGIAVIRVSGPKAIETVSKIWHGSDPAGWKSHTAHYGRIVDPERKDDPVDECVATIFRGPASFTGEDTIELSLHGSRWIQRETLSLLARSGARLASRGEFTQRALVNGRIDLARAEAVADVIASSSRASHRLAASQLDGRFSDRINSLRDSLVEIASLLELELDFSEEDVEFADRQRLMELAQSIRSEVGRLKDSFVSGQAIKEGIPVAIIGAANAGKSSLLNALLGEERAIVSDIPGTTRDTVEETVTLGDYRFRFIDTAGIRETADTIEKIGIDRSRKAMSRARIAIAVIDPASAPDPSLTAEACRALTRTPETPGYLLVAINKSDIRQTDGTDFDSLADGMPNGHADTISISALKGTGLDALKAKLVAYADSENSNAAEGILVTNARHAEALAAAEETATDVIDALRTGLSGDLIAEHLRQTIRHLSSITGDIPSTQILHTIFSRFCIGK